MANPSDALPDPSQNSAKDSQSEQAPIPLSYAAPSDLSPPLVGLRDIIEFVGSAFVASLVIYGAPLACRLVSHVILYYDQDFRRVIERPLLWIALVLGSVLGAAMMWITRIMAKRAAGHNFFFGVIAACWGWLIVWGYCWLFYRNLLLG